MTSTNRPTARRILSLGGAGIVTAIAGIASYSHIREVALDVHQGAFIAALIPLSVDGLVLVGTLAIGDGRRSTFTAWLALVIGVVASVSANVYAADPTWGARLVSAWPAAAYLLATEIVLKGAKAPEPAAKPQRRLPAADRVIEARMRNPRANIATIARKAGVKPETARRILDAVPTSPAPAGAAA